MTRTSIFSFEEALQLLAKGVTGFIFRNAYGNIQEAVFDRNTGTVTLTNKTPLPKDQFDFGTALRHLNKGARVAREGWNGKNMWLELQVPDEHSKMTLPYIFMRTADGQQVPWLASQSDMLSFDWAVVDA